MDVAYKVYRGRGGLILNNIFKGSGLCRKRTEKLRIKQMYTIFSLSCHMDY